MTRTQRVLATDASMARTLGSRVRGLLGRRALGAQEALILPQCQSIHTLGMQFAIDAVFVNRSWRVVAIRPHLRPGRLVFPVFGAWGVVECADGTLKREGLNVGDQLELIPTT